MSVRLTDDVNDCGGEFIVDVVDDDLPSGRSNPLCCVTGVDWVDAIGLTVTNGLNGCAANETEQLCDSFGSNTEL